MNPELPGADVYIHPDLGESKEDWVRARYVEDPAEKMRMERLISLVPHDVSTLLDVGTGYGVYLHELLQSRDLDVEGVDISEDHMEWGRARGLKLQAASAHELPYEDGAFDIVVSSEVLEHLTWGVYEESLKELPRVAKKYILMSVPYDEWRGHTRCPYCDTRVNPDYHFRSFHPDDLQGLFPGFKLRNWETIAQVPVLSCIKKFVPIPWSHRLVCAVCNYRHTTKAQEVRVSRLHWLKKMVFSIPMPQRPRWLVGFFERE